MEILRIILLVLLGVTSLLLTLLILLHKGRGGGMSDMFGGGVGSSLGSSGVPETFLIDGQGVVRRQYVGDIRADQVDAIVAAVRELR